jgi:hypothetical protein
MEATQGKQAVPGLGKRIVLACVDEESPKVTGDPQVRFKILARKNVHPVYGKAQSRRTQD